MPHERKSKDSLECITKFQEALTRLIQEIIKTALQKKEKQKITFFLTSNTSVQIHISIRNWSKRVYTCTLHSRNSRDSQFSRKVLKDENQRRSLKTCFYRMLAQHRWSRRRWLNGRRNEDHEARRRKDPFDPGVSQKIPLTNSVRRCSIAAIFRSPLSTIVKSRKPVIDENN